MTHTPTAGEDGLRTTYTPRTAARVRVRDDAAVRSAGATAALALVTCQILVAAVLIHWFRIEGPAFANRLVPLAVLGFLPHHFLPARHRLWGFVALSLGAVGLIFGWSGLWLIGVVGVFVAVCRLPIPFAWRVGVVALIAAVLAAMRAGIMPTPWSPAIWPILASILMFRLIAYLYDLRHGAAPKGLAATLAYFFLLPNVTFTLFPVVDSASFGRTYYDRPATEIYTEGVRWILRGVLQLVLYRLVYQYVAIPTTDVVSTTSLVRFLLGNFGLYLRVSGSFHLAIGLLHLYGFRLPETHRLFYLSSSFTDFWRRINIYWKDFMQKLVFAPTFYPLNRRIGPTRALTVATLAVFAATWFFHAYQWFWILGRWEFSVTDTMFWGILALVLVVNSQREMRRGRTRAITRGAATHGGRDALSLALRTAGTFTVICLLWALWNSPTPTEFLALFRVITVSPANLALLLAAPAAIGIIAIAFDRLHPNAEARLAKRHQLRVVLAMVPVVCLAVLGDARVAGALGPTAHRIALTMRSEGLNRADARELQKGYYEQLTETRRFNGDLWRVYAQRPAEWMTIERAGLRRTTSTFMMRELVPNASRQFKGAPTTINSLGMRDQEYAIAKPAGTWRIALLGKSHVLGEGVPDDSTFEAILERELNASKAAGAPRIEILNFAVSGLTPLQQDALMDGDRIRRFAPDVVLLVGHETDRDAVTHLVQVGDSIAIPYDTMRTLVRAAAIRPGLTNEQRFRALQPFAGDVTGWAYRHVAEQARGMGARPVWVYVPLAMETTDAIPELTGRARAAGFRVLDIPEMFLGHDENELALAPWDNHPNAAAHRIIADRLLQALERDPSLLGRSRPARSE
jgi:D-alanyl-lipoteichoic acid acyltransferase DltB (MBOAT superfamily)